MKVRVFLSETAAPIPSAKAGKLAVVERVTAEADLKAVTASAGHEPLYLGADLVGWEHGAAVAKHALLPQVEAGLMTPAQARSARLLRVQMRTSDQARVPGLQLPASPGWSRHGPAVGVHDGRHFVVWTWAVPRSQAASPAPTRSATPSDEEWQDE